MEKRIYSRKEKPFPVNIKNRRGLHLNVTAVNTSAQGLCIQCNTFERNLMTPLGSFVSDDGKPIDFFLGLELPLEEGKIEKVNICCQVVYSRRISSKECRVGLHYSNLDRYAFDKLVEYIDLKDPEYL